MTFRRVTSRVSQVRCWNLGLSLRRKEVEDLPRHALSLIRLKEKLSVRRAL